MKNKNIPLSKDLSRTIFFALIAAFIFISLLLICTWYRHISKNNIYQDKKNTIHENRHVPLDNSYAKEKVTIHEKQITIRQILEVISHDAKIYPFMSAKIAHALNEIVVSINVDNESAEKVLRDLLEKRGYTVEVDGHAVLIYLK